MTLLLGAVVLTALMTAALALVTPDRHRSVVAGTAAMLQAASGIAAGAGVLSGHQGELALAPDGTALVALGHVVLRPEPLGALFLVVMSGVALVAALFGIGYAHGRNASRTAWTAWAGFVLGLQTVALAGDVAAFLLGWELMALGSTVLVLTDHASRAASRSAGLWYAAMTHLSFLLVLCGMGALAAQAGSGDLRELTAHVPPGAGATAAWLLLATGFLTKAGAVPLHVWLPRAHPEAPSHVSAVMSGAMVNTGIYGLLLLTQQLLPEGPRWWGVALLLIGLVSAAYGILQASVASDLKRLLAYSTTENVGLMVVTIALADLYASAGLPELSDLALLATGLLVVSHAAFKTLLFLGAGAVLHATGERDLDRLGGLGFGMPLTAVTFGVGALAAAALPVTSGFVAEWVLLQTLIQGGTPNDPVLAVLLPAAMGVVALTAGLALLTFAKAFGIAFLARPRSDAAAAAEEHSWTMRAALLLAATTVLAVGLIPGSVADLVARALANRAPGTSAAALSLPFVDARLDPVALLIVAAACAAPVLLTSWWWGRQAPRRRVELGWGCGGARVSPRMQYTATSYAEPLVRVFGQALSPQRELEVQHFAESRHLIHDIRYTQVVEDVVETTVYLPAVRLVGRLADRARALQNGSIQRYLGYSFGALMVVLLVASTW